MEPILTASSRAAIQVRVVTLLSASGVSGNSVRDLSGRSVGSGVGATVRVPIKTVSKAKGGSVQTSSDTARKLATEMGGMKKGGKPKDGLAVMIAIGKPVKKAVGGAGKTRKGMCEQAHQTRQGRRWKGP